MKTLYLPVVIALMLLCDCDGAGIRIKRSEVETDSEGFCVSERTWQDDCNQCWCSKGGAPSCTLKGCIHLPIPAPVVTLEIKADDETTDTKPRTKRSDSSTTLDEKCVPGTTWKVRCNTCFCKDDGVSACTRIGCR